MAAVRATRGRPPRRAGSPRGEAAVREALVDAATELFAARGPSNVSIREVAEAAGVNHGLVHHYFASKDGLLTVVLDRLAARVADEIATDDDLARVYAPGGAAERHGRILAAVLLEARDPADVKSDFPVVSALVERLRARGVDELDARERAAQVTAFVVGWQFFESYLSAAAGLDLTDDSRARLLDAAVHRLLV